MSAPVRDKKMKQDVFEILLYLFENYVYEDGETEQDRDTLQQELQSAGFHKKEIGLAFDWLESLTRAGLDGIKPLGAHSNSMRFYSPQESERLDTESQGFILFLEQMGVLDHTIRETVIDRVMALDSEEVDLEQLKWVILMVLFNQPGNEAAAAWMEDIVIDEVAGQIH